MPIMLSKTYEAFKAADVPEALAQAASVELAGYETRLGAIERDLLVLKWSNCLILAGVLALVMKTFF